MQKFILYKTIEYFFDAENTFRPVRVEIFREEGSESNYRVRIWDQRMYNIYPTLANIDREKGLRNAMYSCDLLNFEISTLVVEDPAFLTGKEFSDVEELIASVEIQLENYNRILSDNGT